MISHDAGSGHAPSALVITPTGLNYFHKLHGLRVAEALRELGFGVEVTTLARVPVRSYDWCVLSNVVESVLSYGQEEAAEVTGEVTPEVERAALAAIRRLRGRARLVSACSLDSAPTHWYAVLERRCLEAGAAPILDFGLQDQAALLGPRSRAHYRFIPNGLTASERRLLDSLPDGADDRPLPWAFVGHVTPLRAALVGWLVREVDPRGFAYMPPLEKITEAGSPHLNGRQYEAVLRRTRYHVWCSHHSHFYMEGERFRTALLAGAVPVKVVADRHSVPGGIPFGELVVEQREAAGLMRDREFPAVRRRFRDEFRALPSLADGLASFLADAGIAPPAAPGARGALSRAA
jgi:hypothetical protein